MIRRAVDEYLARGVRDLEGWRRQWRQALEDTAGVASYLPDGTDYVEEVRADDAERVAQLWR